MFISENSALDRLKAKRFNRETEFMNKIISLPSMSTSFTLSKMNFVSDSFKLTATDLANHLGCKHLTQLNRLVAEGKIRKPDWNDPALAILAKRGADHERAYVDYLRLRGLHVADLRNQSVRATEGAMAEGVDVITQAPL
jgi:uncharacterized protein